MKRKIGMNILAIFLIALSSFKMGPVKPLKVKDVSPWCIRGFDSMDRTPEERIAMLKEMGFTKYGYNKGKGQFEDMKEEFQLAAENNIEITSVFLWLNADRDQLDELSASNNKLLSTLEEVSVKPTIWVSFSDNFFKDLSQDQSIERSMEMIKFVKQKADKLGCKLALYNHRGWFGNPTNQIEILKKLNDPSISMVFNFHHAREYVDEFPDFVEQMTPYLSFVNLSGVNKEGPEIVTLGKGKYEIEMLKKLIDLDYQGPWGILGHIKTEDVQKVLERNIQGLQLLNSECDLKE